MYTNDHKSGFVTIIGHPNMGKSTLMNGLLGDKLVITNSKVQTTRHNIYGIVSEENFQIIYIDTPGLIKPTYLLQAAMMESVHIAKQNADIILWIFDAKHIAHLMIEQNHHKKENILFVLNKIDLLTKKQLDEVLTYWSDQHPHLTLIPISARKNINIDLLQSKIIEWLPKHPPYYPKDMITDRPERFFVQEIIRDNILKLYKQEIPYCVEVVVDTFKDSENCINIQTTIHVERQTQKAILIGHKGTALKTLGIHARKALEKFFQKKIVLKHHIKVTHNWRKNGLILKKFGYICPNSKTKQ